MRVQPPTVFAGTINGLGGFAVPMGFAEVATAKIVGCYERLK
jgi:TRAP-type C4-dicarboxylate transport system substrate-binding protein